MSENFEHAQNFSTTSLYHHHHHHHHHHRCFLKWPKQQMPPQGSPQSQCQTVL